MLVLIAIQQIGMEGGGGNMTYTYSTSAAIYVPHAPGREEGENVNVECCIDTRYKVQYTGVV